MQSTFIKIKFMALLRHLENDNKKCLLEIVPDVSCIENIDKIKWNEENKPVEYSVPVTYKIIIKKDTYNNHEKIYYSCIDFQQLTAASNLACGDAAKGFSDNFILRVVSSDSVTNLKRPCHLDIRENNEIRTHEYARINKAMDFHFKEHDLNHEYNIQDSKEKRFAPKAVETDSDSCKLNDGKTINIKPYGIVKTISKETITDITEIRSDQEKKRKFTITSICTLNTINTPAITTLYEETINNSKIQIKDINKCNRDMNINECLRENKELSSRKPIYMINESQRTNIKRAPHKRILPDTRVAHFMMTVEDELLPLKIMLSEIYRKCTLLGLFWKSNVFQSSSQQFSNNYINLIQNKPKCNRVVYSIVFEE